MSVMKPTQDPRDLGTDRDLEANHALEADEELPNGKVLPSKWMTEEEFVEWCDEDTRAEWVDGEVILMSPVSLRHVRVDRWLLMVLQHFVEHYDLGEMLGPEFMVRFATQRSRRMPDLLFVSKARSEMLLPNHAEGPPDLLIEIVSPESESRDWRIKYLEYERAGVREYWIIDPNSRQLEAYQLIENEGVRSYQRIEEKQDRVPSTVLPNFYIRPSWLWQEKLPDVISVLRELGVKFE